jgi:hypothetical protein
MKTIKTKPKTATNTNSREKFEKAFATLLADVKSGKGVDVRAMKEYTDGQLLAMFILPVIQSEIMSLKDAAGFRKIIKKGM